MRCEPPEANPSSQASSSTITRGTAQVFLLLQIDRRRIARRDGEPRRQSPRTKRNPRRLQGFLEEPTPGFEPGTPSLRVKCSGQLSYVGGTPKYRLGLIGL